MLAETATDQKTRDRADKILRPAMRTAGIVKKFLTLARQRQISKSILDVQKLINESLDMLSYQLASRNVKVNMELDGYGG